MKILIKNINIIHENNQPQTLDVLCENGIICKISENINDSESQIIDGKDKILLPGFTDMKANFCDPGFEYKEDIETGSNAALAGGFTRVALTPKTQPAIQTKEAVGYILSKNAYLPIEVFPTGAATIDLKGALMTEMIDMNKAGAVAFSDPRNGSMETAVLIKILQYLQHFNGLLIFYPFEKSITLGGQMHEGFISTTLGLKGIPALAEEIAISKALDVLEYAGGKIHFTGISTQKSKQLIQKGKEKGLQITADVNFYNLICTDERLVNIDSRDKVFPPYREKKDIDALIDGLLDGTIDAIVSDHIPQDLESKLLEFDQAQFGMAALEWVFPLLFDSLKDKISLSLFIKLLSENPNKILKLSDVKIKEGAEANFFVFNPNFSQKILSINRKSKSDNIPFIDETLIGKIEYVLTKNKLHKF